MQKVLLVKEDRQVQDELCGLIGRMEAPLEVRAVDCITATIEALISPTKDSQAKDFSLVISDFRFSDGSVVDCLQSLNPRNIHVPLLIYSGSTSIVDICTALDLGAMGYVPDGCDPKQLLEAISVVLSGNIFLTGDVWTAYRNRSQYELDGINTSGVNSKRIKLGVIQLRVLKLIAQGRTNKEIAINLNLSEATIKYHVGILLKLTNTQRRTACVHVARELKILD